MRRFAGHSASPYVPSTDAVAVLTYTSGTTGPSKGAMNLHRNMFHSARVFTDWFDLDSSDVVLGVAPLFHITGLVAGLAVTAMSGAPLILMHRFDAETVTACAERHRATFAVGTSTAFVALCAPDVPRGDVRSLTKVASGGAPLPTGVVARVRETLGIDLRGVYGLTETTSPTHLTPLCGEIPVDAETGVLATGIPVPGAEVRIVSDGIDCAIGDIGEIFVRGPMVVPGYWNLPDESAHAIQDGWLATGDVGRMDRQGWLFVVDRTKDLINAGGYKVWPREVEDVLVAHDAVHDAAVIGIPDQYRGETVKAYVALRPGKQVTAAELIEFCRGRMAAYKYPRHVEFVAEVPKNASGKTLRRALRDN
jgi:long-chain acyl-CoA synthetase